MIEKQKNRRNLQLLDFSVPFVRELVIPTRSVKLDMPVLEVLKLFQDNPDLPAFPVVDQNNRYFGIASRRNYLNIMTRAFARELFARKEVVSLLKINPTIFLAPMIAHAEDRIDQVIMDFLNKDPEIMFEALPVMAGEEILGIVKIADMMLKLSESQGALIGTMEKMSARLKDEVASAATLQRNLLRPEHIQLPGVRGLSTLLTSSEVGGDFYDYYCIDDRWVVMLVGDVSGHGVAAGTMVSAAKAGVNLLESDKEKEPHIILARLSDTILKTARQSLLMTMFAVCLDTRTGELKYANAGHQFAYIYRAITGCLEVLELGGLPLGRDEGIVYEQGLTEMDVGDRLFLYTDGIVEEENVLGECFGYDRLEELLALYAESGAETLRDRLLESLVSHVGHSDFGDDVTIFYIEHHERHIKKTSHANSETDDFELVRIVDRIYRANTENAISSHIVRQNLVFLADKNFSDLIPDLAEQGVRRVLLRHLPIHTQLGWNNLLRQHQKICHDDLAMYLTRPSQHREFHFTHSDDKAFIIDEVDAWLQETTFPNPDRLDAVILILDELIENGLFAAPRDGKSNALYKKGSSRALQSTEMLRLTLSYQDGLLGISLIDNWGTLTPTVFLNRLSRNVQGIGLDSGIGGGGLYLIWRLSDYLQIRVSPYRQTQVCAFLDLNNSFDPEVENSFQFLYHTEVHETVNSLP
jgi:serine phosphatase RsbU (regulator of sigma subunit)